MNYNFQGRTYKMALKKYGDLEIEQEAGNIVKNSKIKTLCLVALFLFLILGFIGLTGGSWLAKSHIKSNDGALEVTIPRIGRNDVQEELLFTLQPHVIKNKELLIAFNVDYLRQMYIKQILPRPIYSKMDGDKIIYIFSLDPMNQPVTISFLLEPQNRGFIKGRIGVQNLYNITTQQFIYP